MIFRDLKILKREFVDPLGAFEEKYVRLKPWFCKQNLGSNETG